LEPIDQQRLSNSIDGRVMLPIAADHSHSCNIMCADDVDARRRPVPHESIECLIPWNVLRQPVVRWVIERRERVHVHVRQMMIENIFGSLFDSLSPVNIRVVKDQRTLNSASREFVEIWNVVWKRADGRPSLPQEQHSYDCNSGASD